MPKRLDVSYLRIPVLKVSKNPVRLFMTEAAYTDAKKLTITIHRLSFLFCTVEEIVLTELDGTY